MEGASVELAAQLEEMQRQAERLSAENLALKETMASAASAASGGRPPRPEEQQAAALRDYNKQRARLDAVVKS